MREVEFQHLLDADNILRVRFTLERGLVQKFVIQLECRFADEWAPVVRYDTAHGFAHCDRIHPHAGQSKVRMQTDNYNQALDFAMHDLTSNWQTYRRRYEEWQKGKK